MGGQHTPLYTTYIEGAAPSGPAAPSSDASGESWHANPALGCGRKIETRFPRPDGDAPDIDLSEVVFPAEAEEREQVARLLTGPLPEHLRDPFDPSEEDD